jgi:hypothetical protein
MARPDSCLDTNVLALLHESHMVNNWLTRRVTVEPKLRVEAKLRARLPDRNRPILLRDVVNTGPSARDSQQRCLRRRIDMQRGLALWGG